MKGNVKKILFYSIIPILCCFFSFKTTAQELNAKVIIIHKKIRGEDASTFDKMQESIQQFMNTRHWTSINYKRNERIDCRFLIDLQGSPSKNVYKAQLTIQSSRPIYNTSYSSTALNYKDKDIAFRFDPFQPLVFNENRITGNDAQESNLTAVLAYYAYIIIGIDQDSFSPDGGHAAFETAQKIVNDAPRGRNISGWEAFDGNFNRYWLVENLLNVKYKQIHDIFYTYYRKGLDVMYDNADKGRMAIITALNKLNAIYANTPKLMFLKVFFASKSEELADIYSAGPPQERMTILNLLEKMNPSNSTLYQKKIKP